MELLTEEERKPSEAVLKEKFGMDIPVQDSNPPTASNSVLKKPGSNVNLEMKRSSSMSLGASKLGRKSKGDFDIDLLT